MKFIDYLQTAINSLKANKIRAVLTMLGIIIGIASVVTIISLGSGVKNLIVGQIMSMGSNTIFVEPGSFNTEQKSSMMQSMTEGMTIKTLKYDDALAIEKHPDIDMTAPFVNGVARMVYKNTNKKITFMGATPNARKIDAAYPILGRGITESDVKSMARVVDLGYNVRKELFGDENPIGKTVRIKNINFKVVGVTEEQGSQMFMNLDDIVYVPLTTAQKLLLGQDYINWIVARATNENKIDNAVEDIRLILREKHNIYNPENDLGKDDFKIMSQKETANMLSTITDIFTVFLSAVASIALLVGGIGIMNIMLVSVSERTKEIGLRKAVGAKRKDILYQFLAEALLLTFLGGIIGIILGIIFSYIGGIVIEEMLGTKWIFIISFKAIALAFGVSTIIGVIFGIFPARKAADLNPIEALRYE
ncbi:MAG: ABC transporter permease [Patescibacteria group bacterium]|nr:ABC transporter permease [Patescibacteria group bacterium]